MSDEMTPELLDKLEATYKKYADAGFNGAEILLQLAKLARRALSLEAVQKDAVCSVCNWTNVNLLNIGETNQTPFWICHGCVKEQKHQLAGLQSDRDKLIELKADLQQGGYTYESFALAVCNVLPAIDQQKGEK